MRCYFADGFAQSLANVVKQSVEDSMGPMLERITDNAVLKITSAMERPMPSSALIEKDDTVSEENNDSDENPYTPLEYGDLFSKSELHFKAHVS